MKLLGLFEGVGPTRENNVDAGHNDEEIIHSRYPNRTCIARKGPTVETFLPLLIILIHIALVDRNLI